MGEFKFATLKNVLVKVYEKENEVEVKVELLDSTKKVVVYYKPINYHERGDFKIEDNHQDIEISRSYMISVQDDVEWDFETIYPCDTCVRKQNWIRKLEAKVEELKGYINKLTN